MPKVEEVKGMCMIAEYDEPGRHFWQICSETL